MADAKKSFRKKRGTAKAKFHRFLNTFTKEKEQADNVEVLKLMMADLESAYKDMEMKHQNYTELLDSEDEDDKQDLAENKEDMERVDLKSLDLESEMNTTTMISQMKDYYLACRKGNGHYKNIVLKQRK